MTMLLLSAFFFGTGLLHLAWAFGWRWGLASALPEVSGRPALAPSRAATLTVAAALSAAGLLVLAHAGALPSALPRTWTRILLNVGAGVFALRAVGDFRLVGFFKRVRGTRFATADTFLHSPLCVAVAFGLWTLARA